jgi:hypothetical protein
MPQWMFDPSFCAVMELGVAQASIAALCELRTIIDAAGRVDQVIGTIAETRDLKGPITADVSENVTAPTDSERRNPGTLAGTAPKADHTRRRPIDQRIARGGGR